MDHLPLGSDGYLVEGTVTPAVRVDQVVALQLRQPMPALAAYKLQVGQAPVPATWKDIARYQAALLSLHQQGPKVADAEGTAIRPQQGQQVDTQHDPAVLATPMVGDQGYLAGVGLLQSCPEPLALAQGREGKAEGGGIVQHQQPYLGIDKPLGLLPQRLGV